MNKVIASILVYLFAVSANGEDVYEIECSEIDNEASFSIKGEMRRLSKTEFAGTAHSFRPNNEFGSIGECRIPWYEKFPLSGKYDVKFYFHEHEYSENCILRFVYSEGELEGRMWVYLKGNPSIRGAVAKARCNVSKSN